RPARRHTNKRPCAVRGGALPRWPRARITYQEPPYGLEHGYIRKRIKRQLNQLAFRTICPRYTAAEAAPGPGGLTVVAFRDGTPYRVEDLIYDEPAPSFFVRCTRNRAGPVPGICLYERRIDAADVVVRFPRDWLRDWRMVADKLDRLLASLRPVH